MKAYDYIALSGDLTNRADVKNILVIHQNGKVNKFDSVRKLKKYKVVSGDSIFVLPKIKGKGLQHAKDITQVLYNIAVATGVVLAI